MNKIIIGNWKMNGSIELLNEFIDQISGDNVAIALPNVFLGYASAQTPKFQLAAQDCSIYSGFGAHTGEISAEMLAGLKTQYVILGHSERRSSSASDTVSNVLQKLKNIIDNKMTVILCVSEDYASQIDVDTFEFIKNNKENIIMAYEPVSAIGTGVVPSVEEISAVLSELKEKYFGIRTIYGGSVNSGNIKDILSDSAVDGVLIGGASLKLPEFKSITEIANTL